MIRTTLIATSVAIALISWSCSKKKSEQCHLSGIAGGCTISVSGTLKTADSSDPISNATIYSMDSAAASVQSDETGRFRLPISDSSSTVDIIAVGERSGVKYSKKLHWTRDSNSDDLGDQNVEKSGTIKFVVQKVGQSDHSGIDVFIPGTSFFGKTDSTGSMLLAGVPQGEWQLRTESNGYSASKSTLNVQSGETVTAGPFYILIEIGVDGRAIIANGAPYVTSKDVLVQLSYTSGATLFKLAENVNFLNTSWSPIVGSTTWSFSGGGQKTLYVQFANANGLTSSPFSTTVDVVTPPRLIELSVGGYDRTNQTWHSNLSTSSYSLSQTAFTYSAGYSVEGYNASHLSNTSSLIPLIAQWTAFRYATDDQEISLAAWIPRGDPVNGPNSVEVYFHEVNLPRTLGAHRLQFQIRNIAGESSVSTLNLNATP